jgi:hypothetical protein
MTDQSIDMRIDGNIVPKDSGIFGSCKQNNEPELTLLFYKNDA